MWTEILDSAFVCLPLFDQNNNHACWGKKKNRTNFIRLGLGGLSLEKPDPEITFANSSCLLLMSAQSSVAY
jgi:hypothetical protein